MNGRGTVGKFFIHEILLRMLIIRANHLRYEPPSCEKAAAEIKLGGSCRELC